MNRHITVWPAVVALTALLSGSCVKSGRFVIDPEKWPEATVDEGRRLYRSLCAGCHGPDGTAQTRAAQIYFPAPRNLAFAEYRFRTTASGMIPQPSDLVRTIAEGLPGTAMPAWKHQLGNREMMSLVLYVQSLSPRFQDEDEELEEDDILVQPDQLQVPPSSPELIARGRDVYKEMKCFDCHGDTGRGDGPSSATVKNQDGTKGHVFDFTSGLYKGGNQPVDVYRTFMTGLDGTAMPSYVDSITEEKDRWALVYYVLSLTRPRGLWFYVAERPTWYEPMGHK